MMKIIFKIVPIVLLTFFWQCSYAQKSPKLQKGDQRPEWVDNPYAFYSQDRYFVGVGSGDTRDAAEKNAIAQIARVFQTKIQVDQTLIETINESLKKNKATLSSESTIQNTIRLQSNIELKNVKINQTYFSEKEGLYYVLATLNRPETAALLKQDFEENNQLIKKYFEDAFHETNKLHQLANINRAVALAQINQLINEQFKILTGGQGLKLAIEESKLFNTAKKIREQILVKIKGEGSYADEINAYLREVIGKLGFSITNEDPDLSFFFTLSLNKTNLQRPGIVAFNWQLSINIEDNVNHITLKTFNLAKRTAAISEGEAQTRILRTIKKELTNRLYKKILDYLNGF